MHGDLAPQTLLAAYAMGIFPMADRRGNIAWFAPDPRAIIELDGLKVSRSLRGVLARGVFEVTLDRAFRDVIEACADRKEGTWISAEILEAYCELHRVGFAHSVEIWKDGELVGGLYGVAMGGVFCGESMFYRVSDASKVALVWLVERMRARGFAMLDVQFLTGHLRRMGAIEIPRVEYERRLREAIVLRCSIADVEGKSESAT
jgi:leucyl/phenylalanyl-tRNA--protein transferase